MLGTTKICLLMAGLALFGCGDEEKRAAVSQQTNWQIGCVPGSTTCGTSRDAHGLTEGVELKVQCSRDDVGLDIMLTDPGQPPVGVGVTPRSAGRLIITNLDPERNRCSVRLEERDAESGEYLVVIGQCGSAATDCKVTGAFDKNDWDFDGTIVCNGLATEGQATTMGALDFRLQAAGSDGEPAVIQAVHCK